jgi:predicted dehydrogenase
VQDKVRIGVVGCGNVARSTYLPGLLRSPLADKTELVAVFSRSEEKARWAKEAFGAREWYTDHDEMMARAEIDAVINLTPKLAHAELGWAALAAGKHLYIEKPMTTTMAEADALVETAGRKELKLVCAPSIPMWPVVKKVSELVRAGVIGQPCFARAHGSSAGPRIAWYYMKGAGPVFDIAVYPLSVLTEVLGPATRISAFSGLSIPERELRDGSTVMIDEDDNTHMLLDFGDCVYATCDGTYVVRDYNAPFIEFFGSEGTINVRRDGLHMWLEVSHGISDLDLKGWLASRRPRMDHVDRFSLGMLDLVDCILTGHEPVLSGERARHTLEIMLGAYQSAREGRIVELRTMF